MPGPHSTFSRPVEILLVEDNPSDVRLTIEAFKDAKVRNNLTIATDGVEAMAILKKEDKYQDAARPDLILLDLNLPLKSGHEVLTEIKADEDLKSIPIVVLTTSSDDQDILKSYEFNANCYITKPVDFDQFLNVVKYIESFWLEVVILPELQYQSR